MAFPELAWRQLAVIKLWAIVDTFFPYKQYMDAPWSEALTASLHRMAAVRDAREYTLAMAEMANRLGDNHVMLASPEMSNVLGWFSPGLQLVRADGRIAVAGFASEELARTSGLKAGDVIVSVDGEDVGARLARLGAVTGGSRDDMKQHRALAYLLTAPVQESAAAARRGRRRPPARRHAGAQGVVGGAVAARAGGAAAGRRRRLRRSRAARNRRRRRHVRQAAGHQSAGTRHARISAPHGHGIGSAAERQGRGNRRQVPAVRKRRRWTATPA